MQKRRYYIKQQSGSVSLFILLSCLFFLIIITSVNISFKNKEENFNAQYEKIKANYEKYVENEAQVYEESIST